MMSGAEREPALVPGRVEVLPGWSARTRILNTGWGTLAQAIAWIWLVIGFAVLPPGSRLPLFVPLVLFFAALAWSMICLAIGTSRVTAEKEASYTTLGFGRITVPTVDSRTGVILREAGEPHLDWKTAALLRRQARNK
ncbi:hypothetical protein C5C74_07790 [Rathayibacter sp. AY1E8]|uniref:hypothetical protein n=1 Tax=Rathayibacter sp. AY1A5 TaxID=2080523 RepID=UPI000CE8E813|nr:hypothetical protein [Rathayibacter sp. AY1A5]PPF11406.1 hypothetical protein C5B98_08390 [Rathayibacter sp. AY1A5]PPG18988.1 hypothetical protein C5C74_07790 [Rathayibacter sp. AY1E8]